LRGWIKKLERANQGEQIVIPQKDGTVARFPETATAEAFGHEAHRMDLIYRGEDPGEAHPLTVAKRNALHPGEYVFDADRQPRKAYRRPLRADDITRDTDPRPWHGGLVAGSSSPRVSDA
jgi:hypothetical protein